MELLENLSDSELMDRIKKNNLQAFEVLYNRYKNNLLNFLYRLSGNFVFAEDCLQETFIKLWRFKDSYDLNKPLQPYLYQIARNVFYSHRSLFKKLNFLKLFFLEHKEGECEKEYELFSTMSENQETEIERKEIRKIIDDCLMKIPIKEREAFILTQIEKIGYEKASEILKIPIGTVKSRTARCIEKLQKYLNEKDIKY